jgi:pimeloyl-ACP methyl ester carboxylesterase
VDPPPVEQGIVFTADGAGNFQGTSRALRQAIADQGLPLRVETVDWSHGFGRFLADQVHQAHTQAEGRRLAQQVSCYHQGHPGRPVYLVAHSAGSAVVLAAAEALPPDSVERIILLAPAVSARHDLRPALACARQGVDVFHSDRDWGYLGVGIALVGTADRHWAPAAGRGGFRPAVESPEEAALLARLRQHPWHPCLAWTGNNGGHYGAYQPAFLHAYVLPLLIAPPASQGG